MSKALLVAQREYVENMRTKTFWFGILAAPIGIVLFYALMFLLADKTDVRKYIVLDNSQSKTDGEQWLSKKVFARAKSEHVRKKAIEAIDSAFDKNLPKGRPLRGLFDAERGDKKISKWILSFGNSPMDAIAKVMDTQKRMKAASEALVAAESDPAKKTALERELVEDKEALKKIGTEIQATLRDVMESTDIHKNFERVAFTPTGDDAESVLTKKLQDDEIFAYFVIGKDPLSRSHGSRYISNNLTDHKLRSWFARHATEVVRDANIQRLKKKKGLDNSDVASIRASFSFTERKVNSDGTTDDVETSDKALKYAPIAFVYVLWLAIFIAAQMLLTNTVEEKSNRIIEVLLSSVSPVQLMHGKIYGIALTGLTIVGSWALFLYLGVKFAPSIIPSSATMIAKIGLDKIVSDPLYLGSFLAYFLVGYLFYAAILVAIGSVCNSLKEAQNLMQPVMFALFVPLATMVPIANDPNGTLAKTITYIPLYTPFAMMNRAGGPPPLWEWFASSALILVSLWIAFRGAAKVFRIGVLMTGKPPKITEIIKWMRAPVK